MRLIRASAVPWVLSNGRRRDGGTPWRSFVDVPLANGQRARVFAVASPDRAPSNASLELEEPVASLRRFVAHSPAGTLNVVLVSARRPALLREIASLPRVHVVFDGEEAAPETYTADESASGALLGGARGDGKALFRLSFLPSGAFSAWLYFRAFGASLPEARAAGPAWVYVSALELLSAE